VFYDRGEIQATSEMQTKDQFEDLLQNKAMMSAGEEAYTKFKIDDYMPEEK
jgi:hypothetical protein